MPTKQEEKAAEQSRAESDGASPGGDTLSVTDNRTGKNYEIEVSDGTIRTIGKSRSRRSVRSRRRAVHSGPRARGSRSSRCRRRLPKAA